MNIYLQIIIGFFIADILGGIIHWFEDTYLSYCVNIPILSYVSKENELHHYYPRSILSYSYLELLTYTLPITIFVILIPYLLNPKFFFNYKYIFISLFIFGSICNIIHLFSHMRDCEKNIILKTIQKVGIFCSHEHHLIHHKNGLEKYCVISEYNNHILDNINFWRNLEYIIFIVTGIKPDRKQSYDNYKIIHNYMHENSKKKCPDKPTKQDVKILIDKLHKHKMKECIMKNKK